MIEIVVACSHNGVIGLKGSHELLWSIKEDMEFFKTHTLGKNVVMGKHTFETLGNKPLVGRTNIVLSRKIKRGLFDRVYHYDDYKNIIRDFEDITIIGGAEIYNLFLPIADVINLTMVGISFTNDELEFANFPLHVIDENFHNVYDSGPLLVRDRKLKTQISISCSKWNRSIKEIH